MNCFGEGSFSKRITAEESLEVIGGADKYMAVCRKCFHSSGVTEATSPRESLKAGDTMVAVDVSPAKKMLFTAPAHNLSTNAA